MHVGKCSEHMPGRLQRIDIAYLAKAFFWIMVVAPQGAVQGFGSKLKHQYWRARRIPLNGRRQQLHNVGAALRKNHRIRYCSEGM